MKTSSAFSLQFRRANFTIGMARRKTFVKYKKIALLVLFLGALATGAYHVYFWWLEYKTKFAKYPEFGISLPTDYPIHGIDVSHHQSIINWDAVKDMKVKNVQMGFTFIKATEGLISVDRQFKRNWKRAKEAGLARGAYHFFLAHKNGKWQANNFISTVTLEKGDLPPVLDVEETYGVRPPELRKRVKEWLMTVERRYGVKPIIYTGADFYKSYLGKDFDEYPLWVAHYISQNRPRIEREWLFWQHNETGRVNGIFTRVDFNVFNGDSSRFRQLLVQ
ncbi:MAG: glycoside hydrolase family 25 protein [Chitinophagaceae bacterium]|nr:glycoside hydrolase family 25 protein [Chitinophagaceae bacterium]